MADGADTKEPSAKRPMLAKQIVPRLVIGGMEANAKSEVYSVQYSPDGQLIAGSCGDASIRVYRESDGKLLHHLPSTDSLPMTALRYRPAAPGSKTKNVVISGNATGTIRHWHITSGKVLHTITEKDNQILCLDYKPDGTKFASGGSDQTVRIYDEATKTCITELKGGYGKERTGHSNRIFCVKYSLFDENTLLSAGWDSTILIWDTRQSMPARSIFGTHICGDSVDIHDQCVLSGSHRGDKQLQLWDLGSTELIKEYPWTTHGEPCMLYAARFSRHDPGRNILAGGAGTPEARVYDRDSATVMGQIRGMSQGVYAMDAHPLKAQCAIASGDGTIRVVDY